MTENSAIFNARHGADSFRPHRQPAPTVQDCLKRGNGANWRTTRQLSGECRLRGESGGSSECRPAEQSPQRGSSSWSHEVGSHGPALLVLFGTYWSGDPAGHQIMPAALRRAALSGRGPR